MKIPTPASDRAREMGLAGHPFSMARAAERAVREMGSDAIPFLLAVIEEQSRLRRRWRFTWALASLAGFATIFLFNSSLVRLTGPLGLLLSLSCLFWMVVCSMVANWGTHRLLEVSSDLFAKLADKEQVGRLVELLYQSEGESRKAVLTALTRVFPQLRASDAGQLSPAQRTILVRQMSLYLDYLKCPEGDGPFLIALFCALEQIGDGSFLEDVNRFCEAGGYDVGMEVKAAARRCLPALQAIDARERKGGLLVRAASAPEGAQAQTLLVRPAGVGNEEQTMLVRAAGEEGE